MGLVCATRVSTNSGILASPGVSPEEIGGKNGSKVVLSKAAVDSALLEDHTPCGMYLKAKGL
jgi:hypothetical protein